MPENSTIPRTRMNFGMNAKGLVQMDITVEAPTPGEADAAARDAITRYRQICADKGLRMVDEVT